MHFRGHFINVFDTEYILKGELKYLHVEGIGNVALRNIDESWIIYFFLFLSF